METVIDCCLSDFDSVRAVTDDWVASIIDNNFTDFETTSTVLRLEFFEFDDSVQTARLETLRDKLLKFEERLDDSNLWKELTAKGVPAKKLTVLFWYAVEFALVKNCPIGVVKAGIAAATTYITLCSIKGASAYNIFNQFFYERCFELFRLLQRCISFGSRESSALKPKPGKAKGKGKKKFQERDEDLDDEEIRLDKSEVASMLEDVTLSFFVFFNKVSLGGYPQIVQLTTNLIRDISAVDARKETSVSPVKTTKEFENLSSLSDRCFALFHRLSDEKHSTGGTIILSRIVFPRLAFWGFDLSAVSSSSTIPMSFTLWKDLMVKFLEKRIAMKIPAELKVLIKVLENLYCRCTDRQDYRTKVSQTVVEVLELLPREYQFEFIQRVDCFSKNAKNSVRNFTIEIVPLILKSLDLTGADPGPPKDKDETVAGKEIKKEVEESRMEEDEVREENEEEEDEEEEQPRDKRKKQKKGAQKKKKKDTPVDLPRVEPYEALYSCLIRYCVDKSSSVRGRAVIHLAAILKDAAHRMSVLKIAEKMLDEDKWLFIGKEKKQPRPAGGDGGEESELDNTLDSTISEAIDNLILHIIGLALQDEKANVRKSGLQALSSFFPNIDNPVDLEKMIVLLKKRCLDGSVMVRKQAADSLNTILYECSLFGEDVEIAWLEGVLPMINDREQSVQQSASKLISESIIKPLMDRTDDATWRLLARIEQEDNHRRLFLRTLFYQSREGAINEKIVGILQQKLISFPQHCDVIWMILAELAVVFKMTPKLALQTWYKFEEGDRSNRVRYVAKVLISAAVQMVPTERKDLAEDIRKKISAYEIAAPHISTVYHCLAKLMDAIGEEAPGKNELAAFGVRVLNSCQKQVKKNLEEFATELAIDGGKSFDEMELRLIRVITTIGEVIQFTPSLVERCNELVQALKTIMASEQIQQDEIVREKIINSCVPSMGPSQFASAAPSRAISRAQSRAATYQVGSQGPSQSQGTGSQRTVISSQGAGPIIPNHYIGCQLFTSVVRAYCVLALGKFCLMDYKRAKEFVPVFVKQLRVNTDHIVRNNIIIVICDLCIRNTQLVDRYSPIIAGCLKDRSTLVRHQTLESLTNLIKEQFIRWEGQIMYRFVSTILDKDKKIREYAEFCLKNVLMQQFPDMFYRHFVECLLYFNEITKKHITNDSDDVECDKSLKFTLCGDHNIEARMELYKFMLATFDDKEKFSTMAHICEQAVQPILTGEFDFKEKRVRDLLRDSFHIMSSKEIKLKLDVGKSPDDDDDEPAPHIVASAKKMITDAFRKAIIQAVMPALLSMREFLQERRSPLLKDCLIVLRNICIDHKEQLHEVLDGDKQLQAEIEYDIRRFEAQIAAEEAEKKRKAEQEEKERRRARRSQIVGNIIASAVKSISRPRTCTQGQPNLSPIKMEVDDEEEEGGTAAPPANPEAHAQPGPMQATQVVTDSHMEVEAADQPEKEVKEEPVSISLEKEDTPVGPPPDPAEATTSSSPSSPQKEAEEDNEAENIEPAIINNANVSMRRRRSSRINKTTTEMAPEVKPEEQTLPPDEPTFAIPAQRKRIRERSIPVDTGNETLPPRAFSTPNKSMANITFADLELSAIRRDEDEAAKPSRRSSKLRSARPTLDPIVED